METKAMLAKIDRNSMSENQHVSDADETRLLIQREIFQGHFHCNSWFKREMSFNCIKTAEKVTQE